MVTFASKTIVLDQGITFVFGCRVYVANGLGSFSSHLTNLTELEAISAKRSNVADRSSPR